MRTLTECSACGATGERCEPILRTSVAAGSACLQCTLARCLACRHVFLNPQPDPAELAPFYSEAYHVFSDAPKTQAELEQMIRTRFDGKRLNHSAFVPGGKYLDVGCGLGDMVAAMQRVGMDARGIEPSSAAVEVALRAGRNVTLGHLIERSFADDEFDSISMYHSLEHTPDPLAVLRECARILKPTGELTVVVPNFESLNAGVFGRQWSHLSLPHHLQHFTKRTLEQVARRAGLQSTGMATESLSWSVEQELCNWFRRNLLVPYRMSQALHLFRPVARYLAKRGERTDRGDAIVAHFRRVPKQIRANQAVRSEVGATT